MERIKIQKISIVLLLAIFLPACGAPAVVAPVAGTPALPTATAGAPLSPSIHLEPCRLGSYQAQCGTLNVYENRAAHSGRIIALRVAVVKAQSKNPAPDPIFYLAGGPGDAATEDATRQQLPYSLSDNHDLVFVDQRGTGGSNRVLIPADQPDLSGLAPEEADAQARAWVAKSLSQIDMDPRYYTTALAMDDLEDVRQALGYDKINLYGYSYGATAAQYYLRQHEEHVRAVILGGGSLLDIPVFERWASSSQRALDKVFDRCLANPACQAAFPGLRVEFQALLARLVEQPATDSFTGPDDGQPGSITYAPDYLAAVIRHMTKDAQDQIRIPLLIHRAYQAGDWKGITQFILAEGDYEWWGSQLMEHVIRCSEKWAAFDPAQVARLGEGSYLKGFDLWLSQTQAGACQYTPHGETPEGMQPQSGSQVPVLIFNGQVDPIDPPENMSGAEALFPNSAALVLPYQGHSISDRDAAVCLWSIEAEFIQTGSAAGLQTGCLKNIHPLDFLTE